MKKKVLALLSALVVMSMGAVTAFADESPTVGTTQNPVSTQTAATSIEAASTPEAYAAATSAEGYDVQEVLQTTVDATAVAVQNELLNDLAKTGTTLGNDTIKNAATDSGKKVTAKILSVVNVEPSTATADADGKYTVTLKVADIAAGDAIVILHYNGSAWETIVPSKVEAGAVTFTVSSLSPIAVVKLNTASVTTAPKTGEAVPYAAVIILIGAAGAAIAGKKYFA